MHPYISLHLTIMQKVQILFLLFGLSFYSYAQDSACACCSENYQDFSFWIGDWNVYDTSGNLIGENLITLEENGCLMKELWKSTSKYTGQSINYFNRKDSTWNQVWVDQVGIVLVLKGQKKNNQMIMKSGLVEGERIDFFYNQITWTDNEDGTVTQQWDILDKFGSVLTTSFIGIYKRK